MLIAPKRRWCYRAVAISAQQVLELAGLSPRGNAVIMDVWPIHPGKAAEDPIAPWVQRGRPKIVHVRA